MAIPFTDQRLYLKGTALAYLKDRQTGDFVYFSDKFQTGNISTSVTMGEIRAGLGNAIAAYVSSDATVNVEFAAADFSMRAKAMQLGATLTYGAPVITCQDVTASGTELTVDISGGTPVAELGYSDIHCYVQEVGAAAPIVTAGVAYDIDPATGVVSGFTAEAGKTYKVWYFVSRAGAQLATISTLMEPAIVHFGAQLAVYSVAQGAALNEGTRVGSLYIIVPSLKLGGNGGVDGGQTTNDTTSISGTAIVDDASVITAGCNDCAVTSSTLAYYLYVPCDNAADIQGLALVGGVLSVPVSTTKTITEFKLVMADGSLVQPDPALMSYQLTGAPAGTTVTGNVLTTGTTAGDATITATYTDGDTTYTGEAALSVTSA